MSFTTMTFNEPIPPLPSDLDLAPGRLLGFLLESVEQNDPPSREEEIDDTVNVGPALASQFPQPVIELFCERLARLHVLGPQLFDARYHAPLSLRVKIPEKILNRARAVLAVENDSPIRSRCAVHPFPKALQAVPAFSAGPQHRSIRIFV
jgi:hypothetical protein